MILGIEVAIFCLLMWGICFLGTGNDNKNIKNFAVFSPKLQDLLRNDEEFKSKIRKPNVIITFISNLILFMIILFIFGIFIRVTNNYLYTFIGLLILGESANLFDFIIVDMLWFRFAKHVRISKYNDKQYYGYVLGHFYSFLRGAVMFIIAASLDAAILFLF